MPVRLSSNQRVSRVRPNRSRERLGGLSSKLRRRPKRAKSLALRPRNGPNLQPHKRNPLKLRRLLQPLPQPPIRLRG
ncbi:hypothetical protein KEM55_001092, partial [Ascosphaera atra]